MSQTDLISSPPKALTFDVFGTTVDWRTTVTETLINVAAVQTSSSLPPQVRFRLSEMRRSDWAKFTQEWRNEYKTFVAEFDPRGDPWVDVDTHHHMSLIKVLTKWDLDGFLTADEVEDLSRIWHYLDAWKDSSAGLKKLNSRFVTASLSNGNQSLLKDLAKHGMLDFTHIISSADFKAYKPHPSVYKGAAAKLGLEPSEIAMVAAHLNDLEGAKRCGFRTIYVERPKEEDWDPSSDKYQDAKDWVDMWVREDEGGFEEIARRFGIN